MNACHGVYGKRMSDNQRKHSEQVNNGVDKEKNGAVRLSEYKMSSHQRSFNPVQSSHHHAPHPIHPSISIKTSSRTLVLKTRSAQTAAHSTRAHFFSKLSSPKNDQHRVIQLTLQAARSKGDGVPSEDQGRLINQTNTMPPLGMKPLWSTNTTKTQMTPTRASKKPLILTTLSSYGVKRRHFFLT